MNCGLASPVDDFSDGLLSAFNGRQYNHNDCRGRNGFVLQIHAATKWWCLGNTKMHQNIIKVTLK